MKIIIFLDVDGVLNCAKTFQRRPGNIFDLDPLFVKRFKKILKATGAEVVLSSTWRLHEDTRKAIRDAGIDFISFTNRFPAPPGAGKEYCERGKEIAQWLSYHSEVGKYAILDDDSDMLPGQPLFKTSWQTGLTAKIAKEVINYFKD